MPNDYFDDFFEKLYNAEVEQKQQLDNADGFLVGILGALIGVGAYIIQQLAKTDHCCASCFLWFFAIPYFVALAGGVGCMVRSIWPRFKDYIATPQQFADYVAGEKAHFEFYHQEPELSNRVGDELRSLLRQQHITAGETNRNLIITKHACHVWAKRCLIVAVIFMLLCAFPIFFILSAEAQESKNETGAKPVDTASPNTDSVGPTSTPTPSPPVQPSTAPGAAHGQPDSGGGDAAQKSLVRRRYVRARFWNPEARYARVPTR